MAFYSPWLTVLIKSSSVFERELSKFFCNGIWSADELRSKIPVSTISKKPAARQLKKSKIWIIPVCGYGFVIIAVFKINEVCQTNVANSMLSILLFFFMILTP